MRIAFPFNRASAIFCRAEPSTRWNVGREIFRDPFSGADPPESFDLNPEQREALDAIEEGLDRGKFSPFLLFGVTGSGKTAVYTEAIAKVLAHGGGALYLVPEIALTPLLARKLRGLFGKEVTLDDAFANLLKPLELAGMMEQRNGGYQVTDSGAFWIHRLQNEYSLNYINRLWGECRKEPWPVQVDL